MPRRGDDVARRRMRPASVTEWDENKSLWARDPQPSNPPLSSDLDVDVAVIGAGYTGLSSAFQIKRLQPNKKVVVFEAKHAGYGGSGRNGGMLLTQPAIEYMAMIHPDTHKLTYDATAQCIKELVGLMKEHGYGSDIEQHGALMANYSESKAGKSREYAKKVDSLGMPIEFWDRERVRKEIGSSVYHGGLYDPSAAEADPMKLVYALKKAAEGIGVKIYEDSPVVEIDEGRPLRLVVNGKDGSAHKVSAEALVLGTDAYSSKLEFFSRNIVVLHTELAATKPIGKEGFEKIGWNSRIPFHDDRFFLYHIGSTRDHRITIGAGNVEYFFNDGLVYTKDYGIRERALMKELTRIFPSLLVPKFEYVWSGALSFSPDTSQSVGVVGKDKNIFYGTSYTGHGVTLAFLFGKIVADMYAGKDDAWRAMPFYQNALPGYLPPEPLRYLFIKGYTRYLRLRDF